MHFHSLKEADLKKARPREVIAMTMENSICVTRIGPIISFSGAKRGVSLDTHFLFAYIHLTPKGVLIYNQGGVFVEGHRIEDE